jgi:hypothetical protein
LEQEGSEGAVKVQKRVLIAGSGEEVRRLDLNVWPEDAVKRREASGQKIGFGVGLGDDDHGVWPWTGAQRFKDLRFT